MTTPCHAVVNSIGQALQSFLIGVVKAYRLLLSPWLGSACRFEPTCSVYALQALETHGAAKGGYLTLKRLGRCHPWCEGGLDPVPKKNAQTIEPIEKPRLFSQLTSSPSPFKKLKKSS